MSAETTQDTENTEISLDDLASRVEGIDDIRSLEHLSGSFDVSPVHNSDYYENLGGETVGHVHGDLENGLRALNPDFEVGSPENDLDLDLDLDLELELEQDQRPGPDTGFGMEFKG